MKTPLSLSFSSAMALRLTAAAIIIILFAANVTIANAHQQGLLQLLQLLTSQPATAENRTAEGAVTTSSRPAAIQNATTFQSTDDGFRIQVPQGWVIQDINNTRFALAAEVLQGYGILAQLCPEEQQQETPLANAGGTSNISSSISSNSNSNSCQRGQEIIYLYDIPTWC